MIIDPFRFASVLPDASVLHVGGKSDDGVLRTAHTITGLAFGAAAPNRLIVVAVSILSDVSLNQTILSATIGGVPATVHGQAFYENITISRIGIAFISAVVPAGTGGTVVVNFDSSVPTRVYLASFRVVGLASFVPVDFAADGFNADSKTINCDVQAGGVIMAASCAYTTVETDFGGVPQNYAVNMWAAHRWSQGGCSNIATTQANYPIVYYRSLGTGQPAGALAAVSFR